MLVFIMHDGFCFRDYFKQLLIVVLSVFFSFLHELDTASEVEDATDLEVSPDFPFIRRYNLLSVTFQYLEVLEFIVSDVIQNTSILREFYPTCEFFVNVVFGDFILLKKE
jgi:hypothetical protein